MKSSQRFLLIVPALLVAVLLWRITVPSEPVALDIPARKVVEAPPMCPWRQPEADMRVSFPGATSYRTEALILSSHLRELHQRLGRRLMPEENPLYVHRVFAGTRQIGSVLARRVKGEYGAIEIVLAVKDGAVVRLSIQRQRETAPIAQALNSPSWLQSFKGKTLDSSWQVPPVPAVARRSAAAVTEGARSLLILHEVGERQGTLIKK